MRRSHRLADGAARPVAVELGWFLVANSALARRAPARSWTLSLRSLDRQRRSGTASSADGASHVSLATGRPRPTSPDLVGLLLRGWRKGVDARRAALPVGRQRRRRPGLVVRAGRRGGADGASDVSSARRGPVAGTRSAHRRWPRRRPPPRIPKSPHDRQPGQDLLAGRGSGRGSTAGGRRRRARAARGRRGSTRRPRPPVNPERRATADRTTRMRRARSPRTPRTARPIQPEERQAADRQLGDHAGERRPDDRPRAIRRHAVIADEQRPRRAASRRRRGARSGRARRTSSVPRCRSPATRRRREPDAKIELRMSEIGWMNPSAIEPVRREDVAAAELGELLRDQPRSR